MKRPVVKVKAVAQLYALEDERIVEITYPDGRGLLLSLDTGADGRNRLNVYRADAGLDVVVEAGTAVWTKGRCIAREGKRK